MSDNTYGAIALDNGFTFHWCIASPDGEIFGHIADPHQCIVSGTSGWYRTNDPDVAAVAAALHLVPHLPHLPRITSSKKADPN